MRDSLVHPLRPTTGEKRLLAAGMGVGICGGIVAFTIVTQLGQNKAMLRSVTDADLWFVTCGVVGALGGLYLGRRWMGHAGLTGALRCLAGLLVVSFAGALIGGTLALPFYGTMFGPMMFGLTLAANPAVALLWLNTLICTHCLIRVWRRERDMIFDPLPAVRPRRAVRVAPRARPHNWLTPSLDRAKR